MVLGLFSGAADKVTFLYTLTPGACPRSYGMNVGHLAGLPTSVVSRAAECAARVEVSPTPLALQSLVCTQMHAALLQGTSKIVCWIMFV